MLPAADQDQELPEPLKRKRELNQPSDKGRKTRVTKSRTQPNRSVYYTTVRDQISEALNPTSDREHLEDFLATFWPSQESVRNDGQDVRAVHAVIAGSVLNNVEIQQPAELPKIHQSQLPKEPLNWRDLKNHPFGEHFRAGAIKEITNLESRNCWRVVKHSYATEQPIPLKWVFTYKVDSSGYLTRCRSRVVVRGDLQPESSILSTYAATLAARTFRTAMALVARFDLEMKQFDVVNAFINAKRDASAALVRCYLPDGFKQDGMLVEVDRALYGLRDSPALWYGNFTTTLQTLKLLPCKEEPCMFLNEQRTVFVVFYVDDIQVLYHASALPEAQLIIDGLNTAYELTGGKETEWFLGVRIIRDRQAKSVSLVHDSYIQKVALRFDLIDGSCPSTPLPQTELVKNPGRATPEQIKEYQEKVGSVLYTAIMLRADVAFAASKLSHFLTNPSKEHLAAINWTIRYLFGTRFLAIVYSY